MKTKQQYQNSVEKIQSKMLQLNAEIHKLRLSKNAMYALLKTMEDKLADINVKMEYVDTIQYNPDKKASWNYKLVGDNPNMNVTLKELFYKYVVTSNRILEYSRSYSILGSLRDIDYKSYSEIVNLIGEEISKGVLLGNKYLFKKTLGNITIGRFPKTPGKLTIDWARSNKNKQEILNRGGVPRLGDNNGENWLMYREDESYLAFNWNRDGIKIKNGVYYSFKATNFINTENRVNSDIQSQCRNISQTLNNDKIGNIQKMLHLSSISSEINSIYSNGL